MITKERLEELIEQGATIYSTSWKEEIDLSQYWCEIFEMEWNGKIITKLVVHEDDEHCPLYLLEYLTEDIETAKWEEEFGCIKRTERLELPTWEEIKEDFIDRSREYGEYTVVEQHDIIIDIQVMGKCIYISIYADEFQGRWKLTKENYTLACRKAKELFLGEKK